MYFFLIALITVGRVSAQSVITLAEYEANNNPSSGQSGVGVAADVSGTGITRNGVSFASGTNYSATGFTTSLSPNTSEYFQVTVAPLSGYKISVTHILLNFVRDANGPHSIQLRTNADNFGSAILIDGAIQTTSGGDGLDLSGIANLQNITTTATFRIYGYQASATSGVLFAYPYPGYTAHLLPTGKTAGVVLQGKVATAP